MGGSGYSRDYNVIGEVGRKGVVDSVDNKEFALLGIALRNVFVAACQTCQNSRFNFFNFFFQSQQFLEKQQSSMFI